MYVAAGDPELSIPDPSVPDYAVWNGQTAVRTPWIDLADGNLFSRSPDHSFVRKLIDIARNGCAVSNALQRGVADMEITLA